MHPMKAFLNAAAAQLGRPAKSTLSQYCNGTDEPQLRSWCCWTTFSRLQYSAGYWSAELPLASELGERSVADGGTWEQPFPYEDIAHIIVPKRFIEEPWSDKIFTQWHHEQDLDGLSAFFRVQGIDHHISPYALEVKLF